MTTLTIPFDLNTLSIAQLSELIDQAEQVFVEKSRNNRPASFRLDELPADVVFDTELQAFVYYPQTLIRGVVSQALGISDTHLSTFQVLIQPQLHKYQAVSTRNYDGGFVRKADYDLEELLLLVKSATPTYANGANE